MSSILTRISGFFLITLLFCLTACDSGRESTFKRVDQGQEDQAEILKKLPRPLKFSWSDPDEFINYFDQLGCRDCPPSFGHMITRKVMGDGPGSPVAEGHCQGSLIDENIFLTVRHCLPDSVKAPGDSCEDNVQVILPRVSDDMSVEVLRCDQLMDVSDTYAGLSGRTFQPDWAILKLKDKSPKRFLKPDENNEGISDNESLFGFLPLEDPQTEEISIVQTHCRAIQNSLGFPEFNNDKSPMAFLECDVSAMRGFSGMTLFRKNGDQYSPVGTLSHIVEIMTMTTGSYAPLNFSKQIIISQTVCMGDGKKQASCEFKPNSRKEHEKKLRIKILEQSKTDIDEELRHWIDDKNNPIRWQLVNSENWKNLPEPYLAYFDKSINNFEKSVGGEVGIHYMQNLVPVYAECVRRDFVPDQGPMAKIPVRIPVMEVTLGEGEQRRLVTNYEIFPMKANLVLGSNSPEALKNGFTSPEDRTFVIKFVSKNLSTGSSNGAKISNRYFHFSAVIPLCPKE